MTIPASVPLVTIITPCYGRVSQYLDGFFASICNQTYANWECLIIDDGLDPLDRDKINFFIEADSRFKLLRTQGEKVCQSPYQARNTGLRTANGDVVAFLDIDDLWAPDRLSAAIMLHTCGYDIVLSRYTVVSGSHFIRDIVPAVNAVTLPILLEVLNPIPMLAVSCKKKYLHGMYFVAKNHEDFIFWRHLLRSNSQLSVGIVSPVASHACYRHSSHSISGNKLKAILWIYQTYRLTQPILFAIASLFAWFLLWPLYQIASSRLPSARYWKSILD